MSDVIHAERLTRWFGDKLAVDRLDLRVRQGEVIGLLGHNGAGKTTTVRLLNGVLAPSHGEATVLGLDPVKEGARLRARTGVLTETPAADERLTGRENLAFAAEVYGASRARADELLSRFELSDAADKRVGTYSKGMRQRLALARTLLHDPELLFLDEPTSGLDPVAAHAVHTLVDRLARVEKRTVLLCTHNLSEAARLCDRVVVLRQGRAIVEGAPRDLARQGAGPLKVEVDVEDPDAAAKALRDIGVERRGATLLLSGLAEAQVPDVVAALVAAGARVRRVAPQERTLEEFYLSLDKEASR